MIEILKYCIKNKVSCEKYFSYLYYDDETKLNKILKTLIKIFITALVLGSLLFIYYCINKKMISKK